jgi:predicted metal-dependent phosphotriesterase family hydrolase
MPPNRTRRRPNIGCVSSVSTVRGSAGTAELGVTLMHEHHVGEVDTHPLENVLLFKSAADKMVLSHDASCFIDWLPEDVVAVALTCCPHCGSVVPTSRSTPC